MYLNSPTSKIVTSRPSALAFLARACKRATMPSQASLGRRARLPRLPVEVALQRVDVERRADLDVRVVERHRACTNIARNTAHSASQAALRRGQTVGGDVGHVSKRGEREVRKVERLDEGDLGGGELAVRAELAQRGLEHPLAERTCWIAHGLGSRRLRALLPTSETCARGR